MMQFMQSRLTDQSLRLLDDSKCEDLYYLAEFTIEMAVRETIKPGSYCSMYREILGLGSADYLLLLQIFSGVV